MHDPRGIAYLYEVRYLGHSPVMFIALVLHICAEEIPVAIGVLMLGCSSLRAGIQDTL